MQTLLRPAPTPTTSDTDPEPPGSESLLRLIWDSDTDGMRLTDRDGIVVRANPAYCRLVGRPAGELVGHPLTAAYAPARRAEMLQHYRERFEIRTAVPRFESEVELWDDRRRWFEAGTQLLERPGRPPLLLSVIRDVTDRKQAEAEARASGDLLRTVIAHIPCGVFWKDRDGVYLGANNCVAEDWGIGSPDQVVGRTDLDICTDRADAEFYRACDREVIGSGEPILNLEEDQTRPDGTRATLLTSKVPLHGPSGDVIGVLGVYQDITARKRLEAQLRQASKLEAVGQLAGGVAHDFNNLLTVINGYAELAAGLLTPNDPARDAVAEIARAGERAAGLTRQLLAFGRRSVVAPRVLDLNDLVRDVERLLHRLIGEDIDLAVRLQPGLSPIHADPGHVEQVLVNLAVNARDAMTAGGKLTIETMDVTLDEAFSRGRVGIAPGPYVLLGVSDTGSGIPPWALPHIFEPFFTTKGVGQGTGLGLATVYGVVQQAGGYVGVYSEVGVGTTFKVYLPRCADPVAADHPPAASSGMARGTETVLLAEDEDTVRALAGSVLRQAGYTVLEAGRGDKALAAAAHHTGPIHLLLTDVVMPVMGGRELAERLTAARPGLPILYMSGYTDDAVVRHGVLEDHVRFLQKPFTPAALARVVREALDAAVTIGWQRCAETSTFGPPEG